MFANKGKNPFLLCMYFVYCDAEAEIYKWLRGLTKTSLDNCFKKVIRKVLDWKVSKQTVTYNKVCGKKLEILNKQLHTSISSLFLLYRFYALDELRRHCISIYKGGGGYFLICCCEEYVLVCSETLGLLSAKAFLTAFVCWLFSSYISPTLLMAKMEDQIKTEFGKQKCNKDCGLKFKEWIIFMDEFCHFFCFWGSGNFSCCHEYLINWFYCSKSNFSLKNYSVYPWVVSLVL